MNFVKIVAVALAGAVAIAPTTSEAGVGRKALVFGTVGGLALTALVRAATAVASKPACDPLNPPRAVRDYVANIDFVLRMANASSSVYSSYLIRAPHQKWESATNEYREFGRTESGLDYFIMEERDNNQLVVAFRGTQNLSDWKQNYLQAVGQETPYFEEALKMVQELASSPEDVSEAKRRPDFRRHEIVLTGHSLGGGVATYVGLVLGVRVVAFDSFRLHLTTLRRAVAHNKLFFAKAEVGSTFLSERLIDELYGIVQVRARWDDMSSSTTPRAAFRTASLGFKFWLPGMSSVPVANHSMDVLRDRIAQDAAALKDSGGGTNAYRLACANYYGPDPFI